MLFLMVGGVNTVVGALWFVLFDALLGHRWNGWGHYPALVLTYVFSILCAFVLYRKVVFRVHGHVWRDLMRFASVYVVAFVINLGLLRCPRLRAALARHRVPVPHRLRHHGPELVRSQLLLLPPSGWWRGLSLPADKFSPAQPHEPTTTAVQQEEVPVHAHVSIVVPTYNNVDFVEETIESILAQTYADFELVIADHSSTDGTWEKIQRFADEPRVTLLRTPAGGGAPANWTRVTEAATGDYLKLVCGDDLLEPTCLEQQVAVLDTHPSVVLTSCRRTLVDARGEQFTSARGLAGLAGRCPGSRPRRAGRSSRAPTSSASPRV